MTGTGWGRFLISWRWSPRATTESGGTDSVTKTLAPMVLPRPMVMSPTMVAEA